MSCICSIRTFREGGEDKDMVDHPGLPFSIIGAGHMSWSLMQKCQLIYSFEREV